MPYSFYDTSALVKSYHVEAGTPLVRSLLDSSGPGSLISRIGAVEMLSGFAGKVRAGVFSSSGYGVLRDRFLADIGRMSIRPLRVLSAHYELADEIRGKHAMSRPLRTLDAIQLAVALGFHRVFSLDHFVCADQRLCDVARLEGLSVIQP